EVKVRRIRVRAYGGLAIGATAAAIPDVVFGLLTAPLDFSGLYIQSYDRIGKARRRRREVIAGANIENVPFDVQRRCVPYSPSGRTHDLGTNAIFLCRLGLLRNRIRLPNLLASRGVPG